MAPRAQQPNILTDRQSGLYFSWAKMCSETENEKTLPVREKRPTSGGAACQVRGVRKPGALRLASRSASDGDAVHGLSSCGLVPRTDRSAK